MPGYYDVPKVQRERFLLSEWFKSRRTRNIFHRRMPRPKSSRTQRFKIYQNIEKKEQGLNLIRKNLYAMKRMIFFC